MMLSVSRNYITKNKSKISALFCPFFIINSNHSSSLLCIPCIFYSTTTQTQTEAVQQINSLNLNAGDVVTSFTQWLKGQDDNNVLLDQILTILRAPPYKNNERATSLALSQLSLHLSESLVLSVLAYGNKDVLSCLKFFDWAGRQNGFQHTHATFHAIFKILSKAKLMSLILDYLGKYERKRYSHGASYWDILVMGYAVAGRSNLALQIIGKIRFRGFDVGSFPYHVLLNALVEESLFDAVEVIAKQIFAKGFKSELTHSILVRSLCKQNRLIEAYDYLRGLLDQKEAKGGYGYALRVLIDALCKSKMHLQASLLLEDFRDTGIFKMEHAYGVWLRELVQAGNLDEALEFLHRKKSLEGFVPDVFQYNALLCRLLRENRLREVCNVLVQMEEDQVSPDRITMNVVLCFFCKAGMVDVTLELYHSRSNIGLSPNRMVYNYMINTLCGDGNTDAAYDILKNSVDQGYFPSRKTFSLLAESLCKEGKVAKMKELIQIALEQKFVPNDPTYDKFISALCKAKRVEEGYLLHGELNRANRFSSKPMYIDMIHGFNRSNRGDIAARLLIEMQERGHSPSRRSFRSVIGCLCEMDRPENLFLTFLEMQLSHHEPNSHDYNLFIDGAGHAGKPKLAREAYEMMLRNGIRPTVTSDILMLLSYLKSGRISDGLNFFNDMRQIRKIGKKTYDIMVVHLCKANKPKIALYFLKEMRGIGIVPSTGSYEHLIQILCKSKDYDTVVNLVNDLEKVGRQISSFIGNILLFHSMGTQDLYEAWIRLRDVQDEVPGVSALRSLIGAFSSQRTMSVPIEELEDFIEQCFPLNINTYNILLRSMSHTDHALQLFDRICQRGYEPNRWTYNILVHGLLKHGRIAEAKNLEKEMIMNGFDLTDHI